MIETIISFTQTKQGFVPKIVLASPVAIGENIAASPFFDEVGTEGIEKSRDLSPLYRQIAEDLGCAFFDAAGMFETSPCDSMHMEARTHRLFAEKMAELINEL